MRALGNNISDIAPLAENEGVDEDCFVDLGGNPIDCSDPSTQDHLAVLTDLMDASVYYECN